MYYQRKMQILHSQPKEHLSAQPLTLIDKIFAPSHDDEELLIEDEEEEGFDYSCKHCKFKTNLKEDLKHHLAWNHKKMKKTATANQKTCDECGKAFAQAWNLRRHKEKVHIVF